MATSNVGYDWWKERGHIIQNDSSLYSANDLDIPYTMALQYIGYSQRVVGLTRLDLLLNESQIRRFRNEQMDWIFNTLD